MCNINNRPDLLEKLRSKGHVLCKGYKRVDAVCTKDKIYSYMFTHVWEAGWNYARLGNGRGRKFTRTKPYKKDADVNASIHVFKTRESANRKYGIIMPVSYYADEVTSYYKSNSPHYRSYSYITVSKVFVSEQAIRKIKKAMKVSL